MDDMVIVAQLRALNKWINGCNMRCYTFLCARENRVLQYLLHMISFCSIFPQQDVFSIERPFECIQDAKLPLPTNFGRKKRNPHSVILNTVSHLILQYFTATCCFSKVSPSRINLKCPTNHVCQILDSKTKYFENYARYCNSCYFAVFLRNLNQKKRKLMLIGS